MLKRLLSLAACIAMLCSISTARADSDLTSEIERRDQYVASLFPFESTAYHRYNPTHIDPINYTGYIAWDGGLIGDISKRRGS